MILTLDDLRELMALRAQLTAFRERERYVLEKGMRVTANWSQAPAGGGPGDNVGNAAAEAADVIAEMERQMDAVAARVLEIEGAIYAIEDGMVKSMVLLHYDCGMTWERTARKIGRGASAEGCRKRVERYFLGGPLDD